MICLWFEFTVGCDGGLFTSPVDDITFTRLLDTSETPRGIAYDPKEDHLYWTMPDEGKINRCRTSHCSGTVQTVLEGAASGKFTL